MTCRHPSRNIKAVQNSNSTTILGNPPLKQQQDAVVSNSSSSSSGSPTSVTASLFNKTNDPLLSLEHIVMKKQQPFTSSSSSSVGGVTVVNIQLNVDLALPSCAAANTATNTIDSKRYKELLWKTYKDMLLSAMKVTVKRSQDKDEDEEKAEEFKEEEDGDEEESKQETAVEEEEQEQEQVVKTTAGSFCPYSGKNGGSTTSGSSCPYSNQSKTAAVAAAAARGASITNGCPIPKKDSSTANRSSTSSSLRTAATSSCPISSKIATSTKEAAFSECPYSNSSSNSSLRDETETLRNSFWTPTTESDPELLLPQDNAIVVVNEPQDKKTTNHLVGMDLEDDDTVILKKRLELLDRVAQVQRNYLEAKGPKVVYGALLQGILDLMKSEYGFISEVKYNAQGTLYLHSHATTTNSWDQASIQYFQNYAAGLKFFNMNTLFGRAVTERIPIISNHPSQDPRRGNGCPAGHPPLTNFLGIPFFRPNGKDVMGIIAIANTTKPGGFHQGDVSILEPFTVTAANLVQAYLQIETNDHLINTLETKVEERTRKLQEAVDALALANNKVMEASAAQLKHFAMMSHEIRTPLNCVIGLSSLLLENSLSASQDKNHQLSPSQQESMQMIVNSGDLLLTVVNDVLDYSKLQNGDVELDVRYGNLQETLNGIVHSIEMKEAKAAAVACIDDDNDNDIHHCRHHQRPRNILTKYHANLPEFITTDTRRLQQILYNLLGNAMKFGRPGENVELAVELIPHEQVVQERRRTMATTTTISKSNANDKDDPSFSSSPSSQQTFDALTEAKAAVLYASHKASLDSFSPSSSSSSSSLSTLFLLDDSPMTTPNHTCSLYNQQQLRTTTSDPTKTAATTGLLQIPNHQSVSNSKMTTTKDKSPKYIQRNNRRQPVSPLLSSSASSASPAGSDGIPLTPTAKTSSSLAPLLPPTDYILRLKVKDYGVGIAQKDFFRIFEPFSQAKAETERVFGGTGLGLAITSKLVRALGGHIWVDSEEGKWSEFIVDLPFHDEPANLHEISKKLQNAHILFVSDCPDTKKHVSTIFKLYNTEASYFATMQDMQTFLHTKDVMQKVHICLAHEDLYDSACYQDLEGRCRAFLFTFGEHFLVSESEAHFRNLLQVLPFVLMNSLGATIGEHQDNNNKTNRRRRFHRVMSSANIIPTQLLRILIAEDNKINQKVLSRVLERMGMTNYTIVDNGEKAVEEAAKNEYDLILMDMQMPVMDGIEATKLISSRTRSNHDHRPKIVFVTAHVAESFEQECYQAGGVAFLTKPFNVSDIEKIIYSLFVSG